eukprot:TRINITY_DN66498_c6_g1_i5.p1 TRINITY_DN66498_c6_g1~~TRINITY_DN66498_c6_g1_i5.p1  ORF type:complete len:646 (-),score=93.93 TRINITY_DN66498_c6_g1_i5:75-2012(-)
MLRGIFVGDIRTRIGIASLDPKWKFDQLYTELKQLPDNPGKWDADDFQRRIPTEPIWYSCGTDAVQQMKGCWSLKHLPEDEKLVANHQNNSRQEETYVFVVDLAKPFSTPTKLTTDQYQAVYQYYDYINGEVYEVEACTVDGTKTWKQVGARLFGVLTRGKTYGVANGQFRAPKRPRWSSGAEFISRLVTSMLPDTPEEAVQFVQADDGAKWPIDELTWARLEQMITDSAQRQMFQITDHPTVFDTKIWEEVIDKTPAGGTEFGYIPKWSAAIHTPLRKLVEDITIERDTSQGTSTGSCRCDCVGFMSNFAVLYGEEKKPGGNDPEQEIVNKVCWDHGNLPYLLATTCYGNTLKFYILAPDPNHAGAVKTVDCEPSFSINTTTGHLGALKYLRKFACLLLGLRDEIPTACSAVAPHTTLKGNKTFTRYGRHWIKSYNCKQEAALLQEARNAAKALKRLEDHQGHGVIKLKTMSSPLQQDTTKDPDKDKYNEMVEMFFVCGEPVKLAQMETKAFVVRLIRGICTALKKCHDAGVIHRDVRLANVVLCGAVVTLVDFDSAYVAEPQTSTPTATEATNLDKKYHAPELRRKQPHGVGVDVWELAYTVTHEVPRRLVPVKCWNWCTEVTERDTSANLTIPQVLQNLEEE